MSARVFSPVRPLRSLVVALLATGVALVVGLAPAMVAHAAPSAQELEQEINTLWNKAEVAIENYNGVHEKLVANQARLKRLEAQLNPLKLQVDLAYARVGVISARLYKHGPAAAVNAVLNAGSPTVFVDDLSMMDQMAKQQQATLADVQGKVGQYDRQKALLDSLVAKLKQQDAQLAAQKRSIQAQLDRLQKLRLQLYGTSGGNGPRAPVTCPQQIVGGAAGTAVRWACAHVTGSKVYMYEFASAGPDTFDCSGFTLAAWAAAGVSLPHKASEQQSSTYTTLVSTPRAGDLVFFGSPASHVGIYIGNGWMIDASHAGAPVSERKVSAASGIGRVTYRRVK